MGIEDALGRIAKARKELLLALKDVERASDDTVKAESFVESALLLLTGADDELLKTPTGQEIVARPYLAGPLPERPTARKPTAHKCSGGFVCTSHLWRTCKDGFCVACDER